MGFLVPDHRVCGMIEFNILDIVICTRLQESSPQKCSHRLMIGGGGVVRAHLRWVFLFCF